MKNVLRGLHLQARHPQGKMVFVIEGEVWDVAVDLRKDSPTFKQWVGATLSAENRAKMYIPPGFAHGFCALSEQAQFCYKCTDFYHADDELTLLWNDPELSIDWPVEDPIISEKDKQYSNLSDLTDDKFPVLKYKLRPSKDLAT